MCTRPAIAWIVFGLAAWSSGSGVSLFAQAGTTSRESVGPGGAQCGSHSFSAVVSADGRYVAFASLANDLVLYDSNGVADVFLRDRSTGQTTRVSVASSGVESDEFSTNPALSSDGRKVVFRSYADNLIPGDTNFATDVFVHDRVSGATECADRSTAGALANFGAASGSISGDGSCVVFISASDNLVLGDTNACNDVFLRDLAAVTTERISLDSSGGQSNGFSWSPCASSDGLQIAFVSEASNLVAGDTNGVRDVFVHDRTTGLTTRVSLGASGIQADRDCNRPSISGDGRFVAFECLAADLVQGDANAASDVFVRDRLLGKTTVISVDAVGNQANGASGFAALSANGRCLVFVSSATNLVPGDTNGHRDCFVRDLVTLDIERVSVASSGTQADQDCGAPSISADGRFVAFDSVAPNLVAGDTNGVADAFVHERASAPPTYCTAGTTSSGCSVSITANANPTVSLAHACVFTASGAHGQTLGTFLYGTSGRVALPWCSSSSSWLCVRPPTQRAGWQNSGGTVGACDGVFALDWQAYQSAHPAALGNPWLAGDSLNAQVWFHDPPACKSSALSDAIELTYEP